MEWKRGSCHCKAVVFEVLSSFDVGLECDCSICQMKGYLHLIVPSEQFRLLEGEASLSCYTFNTGTAKHYFCRTCGVSPFYIPRSHPDGYDVNLRCVEGLDLNSIQINGFKGSQWEQNIASIQGYDS